MDSHDFEWAGAPTCSTMQKKFFCKVIPTKSMAESHAGSQQTVPAVLDGMVNALTSVPFMQTVIVRPEKYPKMRGNHPLKIQTEQFLKRK